MQTNTRDITTSTAGLLLGIAAGAGLMFFLDPRQGRRRRARARDKGVHLARVTGDSFRKGSKDLGNRAKGAVAEVRRAVKHENVDDMVLEERVRSELGRHTAHPSALEVHATRGVVTLRGLALQHEMIGIVRGIQKVSGVRRVDNQVEAHRTSEGIACLQGGGYRERRREWQQENWSPGFRWLVGGAGASIAGVGTRMRFPLSIIAGLGGSALTFRSLLNVPFAGKRKEKIRERMGVSREILAARLAS